MAAASLPQEPARLHRRLAAIIYDGLLLIALEMLVGVLWLPVFGDEPIGTHPLRHLYQLSLLLTAFLFFVGFWRHGGQTLGMRAWRLRLHSSDDRPVRLSQLAIRFVVAPISWLVGGLGFIWSLFDRKRRTWQDLASGTVILHEKKAPD